MMTTISPKRIWTEEEIMSLPDDGLNHEIVDGELVMSPKNDFFHGEIAGRLLTAIRLFVRERKLGAVLDSSTGFWMHNRNCRAPDISFIAKERLDRLGFRPSSRKFFPGAPDLAIEILSLNNSRNEVKDRLSDFFSSGTRLAWVINPKLESVDVYQSETDLVVLTSAGQLEGLDVLPGFRYPVSDLFREWDWD